MKQWSILWLCLAILGAGVVPAVAAERPVSIDESDIPGQAVEFKLEGSNGYSLYFGAYSDPYLESDDGKGKLGVGVFRKGTNGAAAYRVPAIVSDSYVKADLGPFGRATSSGARRDGSGRSRSGAAGATRSLTNPPSTKASSGSAASRDTRAPGRRRFACCRCSPGSATAAAAKGNREEAASAEPGSPASHSPMAEFSGSRSTRTIPGPAPPSLPSSESAATGCRSTGPWKVGCRPRLSATTRI